MEDPHAIEFGTIATLRKRFGFIRCCGRMLDLFFHFNDLDGGLGADALVVGLEVQFTPTHALQEDGVTRCGRRRRSRGSDHVWKDCVEGLCDCVEGGGVGGGGGDRVWKEEEE